jgi:hypothetical protein
MRLPVILVLFFLCGCGANQRTTPLPVPSLPSLPPNNICQGETCPWEFSLPGALMEANLIANQGPNGSVYWMATLGGWPSLYPPGTPGVAPGDHSPKSLSGAIAGDSITMYWACGACTTTWDWLLSGTVDVTHNAVSGNASFNGAPMGPFTGAQSSTALPVKYSGKLATFSNSCLLAPGTTNCPSQGNDDVQVAFAVDSNFNVAGTLILSGVDRGTFTLSGVMIGNTLQLSGTVGTQQVEFVGYFDLHGAYGGSPESLIVFQMPYPISPTNGAYAYSGTLNVL